MTTGPRRAAARALALAALAAVVLAPLPARAYVRYKTDMDKAFFWPTISQTITGNPGDMNGMMTVPEVTNAVTAAAAAWSHNTAENACTYLEIMVVTSADPTPVAQFDSKNSLIFQRTSWCAATDVPPRCSYDPQALALTSVFVNPRTGEIRDADIEVNALFFGWTDLDLHPAASTEQDLQNALTHELGHFIGLDHTCWLPGALPTDASGNPIIPTDYQDMPVPECSNSLPDSIRATTMFASAPAGDVSKRTLEADDRLGLCQIYPVDMPPQPPRDGCACAIDPPAGGAPGVALVPTVTVAAAGALARARRRRRQGSA
jgi:hypothetical protein